MASTTNNYGFPYPEDLDPVDVAGDIQSLAEDIDSKLAEAIGDTVGSMVNGNTENGISVSYDDLNNILNFDVDDFSISIEGNVSGSATVTNLSNTSIQVVASDFNIEISGDVSGSATVSDLNNVNILTSVVDNSHNHIASNITDLESAVDAIVESFTTIDVPSGEDAVATVYNDTLSITENNGILISGTGSNSIEISTNATSSNIPSSLVLRSVDKTFNISGINFDNSASPSTASAGVLFWNSEEGTLDLGMNDDVIQSVGMEFYMPPVRNLSGEDIPNGSLVMATGTQGDRITIAKANASGSVNPEYMIGIATHEIPNGSETGLITVNGIVRNIDTSLWPVGTILYPNSASAGALSASAGIAPAIRTPIAIVLRQHAQTGRIYVRMTNSHKFGEEFDVKLTNISNNDIAIYNSASSLWINQNFQDVLNSFTITFDSEVFGVSPTSSAAFATKGYVDSIIVAGNLPSQENNDGKYLSTNGSEAQWSEIIMPPLTILEKTSNYTLSLSDRQKVIEMNSESPIIITIPLDSSVDFPIGTSIDIVQSGSGQVTIDGEFGVTLLSKESNTKLSGQYSGATIYKKSSNTWTVIGDLTN